MSYGTSTDFLATAINVNDNTTAVNGTDFTSVEVDIKSQFSQGALTVWFTPAAGAAVTIDFEYQVSADGANNWSSAYYARIRVNTNETADGSGIVRTTTQVNFHGISHVRLYRVVVNNGAGNCTAINTKISF